MSIPSSGFMHIEKRRRLAGEKTERRISPWIYMVDEFAILVGVVTALFNIPQLWSIWVDKNIAGVSLASWTAFFFGSVFWLYYALLHKNTVLTLTFSITLLCQALIVFGIFVH